MKKEDTWAAAVISNEHLCDKFTADKIFVALHLAVDLIASANLGGATIKTVCQVIGECSTAAEHLEEAYCILARDCNKVPPLDEAIRVLHEKA